MTRINANGFNLHLLGLFASIRVIRGQIFSLFVCIRPARRSLSEGGCSFVVGPGNDLTIPSLRRNFSLSRQSMKRYLPFVIVIGAALVTLGSEALLYRAKQPQLRSIPANKVLSGKSTESMHIRGNPD